MRRNIGEHGRLSLAVRRAALLLLLASGGSAWAEGGPEWSFGVSAGISKKNDFDATAPFFAASARIQAAGLLFFEPEVGYWSTTHRGGPFFHRERDLAMAMRLLIQGQGDRVRTSAGLGFGFHSIDAELGDTDTGRAPLKYSDTKTGIGAQAGLDLRVGGNVWLCGIARYELLKGAAQNLIQLSAGFRYQPRRAR